MYNEDINDQTYIRTDDPEDDQPDFSTIEHFHYIGAFEISDKTENDWDTQKTIETLETYNNCNYNLLAKYH